jgi:large subunit ribosomal protein LP0
MSKGDRRADYFNRVHHYFRTYKKLLLISVDNVGSTQMHQIRAAIRSNSTLLMGKNTMIKKAIREILDDVPEAEVLLPYIKGNVGLVFTNSDLKALRDTIVGNKVAAPAKVGAYIQCNVTIPAGNTGISPDKTAFFQNLGIPTKVVKGAIEVVNDVLILKEGGRVGASEAELLSMLGITPFSYGCVVEMAYENGSMYEAAMLDLTDEAILKKYQEGLKTIAALSLRLNIPTVAAVPHSIVHGFKNLLAVSLASDFTFPAADKLKQLLANPSAFAAAAPAASQPAKAAAAPVKEEKQEESDEEMGMGLFD